jgi:hypothetical protein
MQEGFHYRVHNNLPQESGPNERDAVYILLLSRFVLMLSSYIHVGLLSDNFPSGIPLKLLTLLSPAIIMPHALLLRLP